MRSISALTLLASCAVLGAPTACSSPAQAEDQPLGESATTAAANTSPGYYAITADLRRCPSPLCGGWFLDALNQSTTRCHDGTTADQCYAPQLDWSRSNLSADEQTKLQDAARTAASSGEVLAIVRGTFSPTNTTPQPNLGSFVITEGWLAENDNPASGTFVWVHDNGLRCLVAPCRNLTEKTLNTTQVTDIAAVDFTPSQLTQRQIQTSTDAMYGPDGLVVAGDRYTVSANGNTAPGRTATAAYLRLPATP